MPELNNNWSRLQNVIAWANMTTNAFAKHIGLLRGENLYQIKRGSYGISLKLATRICEKFPEISKLWLLTGEGDMLCTGEFLSIAVPYYDEDVLRAMPVMTSLTPVSEIVVPKFARCDFAMRYDGGEAGATTILLLRRCSSRQADGGEYVAVEGGTASLVTVEAGRRTDAPNGIVCEITGRLVIKEHSRRG